MRRLESWRTFLGVGACLLAHAVSAQRPVGIDVSDYQSSGISWSTLKKTYGISFGWAKASEGSGLAMANFTTFEANAKAAGVYIGAYHFARYDLDPGTNGAVAEANFFWTTAKNYLQGGGYYLMPMLDIEASYTGQTRTTLSQWVNAWCTTLTNHAFAAGYILKPCIYSSSSHAANYFDSTVTKWISDMADWNGESKQTGAPTFAPWSDWTFWQYDDQNVAQAITTGDGDVFNGTLDELTSTMLVTSATVQHWSGASSNQNWATTGNWDNAVPGGSDTVLFDNTNGQPDFASYAAFPADNVITQSMTIGTLIFSNWTYTAASPLYSDHHTEIDSGKTLTVRGGMVVGISSAYNKGFTTTPRTYVAISGPGKLAVAAGDMAVGNQSSESSTVFTYALLDMSALGGFSYTSAGGTLGIASAVHRRQGGEVFLAQTNLITTGTVSVGIGATGVGTHAGLLHLGQSNTINADGIIFGKDSEGHVDFAPNVTNPIVRIRGQNGTAGVGTLYLGWTTSTGSSWGFGTNDFTAGTVDAIVTNLTISLHAGEIHSLTNATVNALLIGPSPGNSFVVRNTLTLGSCPGTTNVHTSYASGTIDMQGGSFSSGPVVLGSSRFACTGTGTIDIHGGNFIAQSIAFATLITPQDIGMSYGNFIMDGGSASIAGDLGAGGGVSTCAVTNASLAVGGKIGGPTNGLSSLTLNGATLQLSPAGGTNIAAYVEALDLENSNTVVLTNQNLVTGQYPLIACQNLTGAGGVTNVGLVVPAGITAVLVNNPVNQSIDLIVLGTPANPIPVMTGGSWTSSNIFVLTGYGASNLLYHLYGTTNLALPLNQWDVIGATNADAAGQIQFLDQPADTQHFYRLGR